MIKFTHFIPNIFSMLVIGPTFLIVGSMNTHYKFLYLITFIVSLALFLSIMYGLIKEKSPLTFGRLFYLLIFIPLLMYISIMQKKSYLYARRCLFLIGLVYILYQIDYVFFKFLPKNVLTDGVPKHPLRRFL